MRALYVSSLVIPMVREGLAHTSFGFAPVPGGEVWTRKDGLPRRKLRDIDLAEVTVTDSPAYGEGTNVSWRSNRWAQERVDARVREHRQVVRRIKAEAQARADAEVRERQQVVDQIRAEARMRERRQAIRPIERQRIVRQIREGKR